MPTTQTTAGLYLCHMIAQALRGRRANDKPDDVTWADVWHYITINKVEAVAWMGAPEHPTEPIPDQMAAAWQSAADMTLFRELTFDAERETVLRALESRGLTTMTLKGPNTCALYPQPGMRSMSDNDILYGFVEQDGSGYHVRADSTADGEQTVRDVMQQLGYTMASENYGVMSFVKPPVAHFELFCSVEQPRNTHADYYANPWRLALPADGAGSQAGRMRWRLEDEYLFHISHMFKHYDEYGGCGIRFAIDEWAFLEALRKRNDDREYIRQQLDVMGMTAFERQVRRTATIAFGEASAAGVLVCGDISDGLVDAGTGRRVTADAADGDVADGDVTDDDRSNTDDLQFLKFLLSCGIYGNIQFKLQHDMEKAQQAAGGDGSGKSRYLWERIFPKHELLISTYPWVEGKPWLVPFMPFYRLARGIRHNSGKIVAELRMLLTHK